MSTRKAPRARGAAASKASGKAKTAPAKQKPATGQRGVRKPAPPFDHEFAGLLKQLVVDGAATSAAPPEMPGYDSEKRGKDGLTPTERAYLEEHQTAEGKARQASLFAQQAHGMDEGQTAATNTATAQLPQDVGNLLAVALRLRMAVEDEDPLKFGKALTGPATLPAPRRGRLAATLPKPPPGPSVLAQLVQATRVLVEFINLDCAENPLVADEVAAEIKALRGRAASWPGLYFMHAAAQNKELVTYQEIGSKLLFRLNEGKARPEDPGRPTLYVRAAVDLISFVYGHLSMFARAGAGTNGEENPLRRWVRRNEQKEMFEFVAALRMAPDAVRDKHIRWMQGCCRGWTCPPALLPSSSWREQFQLTGKPWHRTKENLDKAIARCSKGVAFSKVVRELDGLK